MSRTGVPLLLAAALSLFAARPAGAGGDQNRIEGQRQLNLERRAKILKAKEALPAAVEGRELDALITALEAGQPVETADLLRVLKSARERLRSGS